MNQKSMVPIYMSQGVYKIAKWVDIRSFSPQFQQVYLDDKDDELMCYYEEGTGEIVCENSKKELYYDVFL